MTHSPFPMRRIASGPKHHWFGYYGKLQFDPSCRHLLAMAVGFEHRSPEQYSGESRCDLHPRSSPDGRSITSDSAHEGSGRQIYWMDISETVE